MLLCFPHGGGTASAYRQLADALFPRIELLAVQYPGRQDRLGEAMMPDIGAIAERVVRESTPHAGRPLAVFGHSMGATVAFEAARRFEQRGHALAALFVSGRTAPSVVQPTTLHLASDRALLDDMRRLGGPESNVVQVLVENPDLAEMVLPSVRNDYKAVETYRYKAGQDVSCPIVALRGDSDPSVTDTDIRPWSEFTSGSFETCEFSGGHFYLDEHADEVASLVGSRFDGTGRNMPRTDQE
ncbi:thioesterase II family protein [Rhodococcus sp. NPDC057014]|uniref:thioesterase II family protein n=1 Tax=Rhodococcus sp. NPDC057014 TaxID=3346000 RepID=UPI0036418528